MAASSEERAEVTKAAISAAYKGAIFAVANAIVCGGVVASAPIIVLSWPPIQSRLVYDLAAITVAAFIGAAIGGTVASVRKWRQISALNDIFRKAHGKQEDHASENKGD